MKKGATPAQIFGIMYDLVEMGFIVKNDQDFKNLVIKKYNEIYCQTSKDTIISNIREDAMVEFQEERFICKLPQDNNKVDLISVKRERSLFVKPSDKDFFSNCLFAFNIFSIFKFRLILF